MLLHMTYLDFDRLASLDINAFRATRPYPWINPQGLFTDAGYTRLLETLPDIALFRRDFGVARTHGQYPHDRLTLDYREDLDIAAPWHEFVAELRSRQYRDFISSAFDRPRFLLNFHWHYTPNGCSVSPHCDAMRKLGSHIFYFNTDDWDPAWGGETLILDDQGRFKRKSAPRFEDFNEVISAKATTNYSLLFRRNEKSWHGVREIHCPEGKYRKVFIVVINSWLGATQHRLIGTFQGKRHDTYF